MDVCSTQGCTTLQVSNWPLVTGQNVCPVVLALQPQLALLGVANVIVLTGLSPRCCSFPYIQACTP